MKPGSFAVTVQNSWGTKRRMASSRSTMRARVGVCTRPAESWALYLHVRARVTLRPTSQSASLRARAERNRLSYSAAGRRWVKPSRMALSVWEEIHSRLAGPFHPAFSRIHRATSSPSRPASVAMTSSPTSPRRSWAWTARNCRPDWGITTVFIRSGSMGRVSISHLAHALS